MPKMKLCRYCHKYYPESEFGVDLTTKKKVYRRHKCRCCYRATKRKLSKKYRQWLIDYKKKHKCTKCGIADYRVLEFHHSHDTDKEFSIGEAVSNNYGFKRIKEEVEKCIIICANCHRIIHYEERGKRTK